MTAAYDSNLPEERVLIVLCLAGRESTKRSVFQTQRIHGTVFGRRCDDTAHLFFFGFRLFLFIFLRILDNN